MKALKYMVALLVCAAISNAQVITPASVTFTGTAAEFAPFDNETHIIDGSGLSTNVLTISNLTTVTHSGGSAEKWATTDPGGFPSDFFAATSDSVIFEFTLGATYTDIDTLVSWPYHDGGNNISLVDLYFSTDGGTTTDSTQTVAVAYVPGGGLASLSALTPVTANHITMVVTDNHYNVGNPGFGGDRTGLGEIRFAKGVVVENPLPIIQSFSADPSSVTNGGTTTLTWASFNTTTASLDQGIGAVPASGSTQVVVTAETTYTLTATGVGGSTNESVTVSILEPSDSLLVDPSLEVAFAGSQSTPGSGWFSFGSSAAAIQVDGGFWNIGNPDGPNAAYVTSISTDDGGSIYQAVTLTNGTTYRLTAAVAQSATVNKCDANYALGFFDSGFGAVLASTNGIVANQSGTFVDTPAVEFTPTATAVYHVGVRNRGHIPGTGADNNQSTVFFDNVRLVEVAPPADPIGSIVISGPIAITGGQGMVLSWNTTDGQSYDVQSKSNLITQASWQTVTNVTGDGGSISVTTAVGNAETFYKVETPAP